MYAAWLALADFLYSHGWPVIAGFFGGVAGAWALERWRRKR